MFDTMTMTKIIGALCGTFLVFLMGKWAADTLYHVGAEGHGDEVHNAYVIEVEEAHVGGEEESGPVFAELFAAADIDKGAKVYAKCKACHKLEDGANSTGPFLFGILNRDIASVGGFGYSGALSDLPGDWTAEALDEFLENPKGYAKGTKMTFTGLKKPTDRANLIAYLDSLGS